MYKWVIAYISTALSSKSVMIFYTTNIFTNAHITFMSIYECFFTFSTKTKGNFKLTFGDFPIL